jgi:hypothetical protein
VGLVSPGSDVARLAQRVTTLVAQGLDVAEAYATAKGGTTKATREYAKALQRHEKAVARHEAKLRGYRGWSQTLRTAALALVGLGVVDAVAAGGGAIGPIWVWFVSAAAAVVASTRLRHAADSAVPPTAPVLGAAVSLTDLRREAIGYSEAGRLSAVRRQLVTMVPAVSALHADAGRELISADTEAAPALAAQVARLAVLDQVRRELPGTEASTAATEAAYEVRDRLGAGVTVYDRLLAAASTMLASPDLGRSSAEVLGPATDALTAYAAGLRIASGE